MHAIKIIASRACSVRARGQKCSKNTPYHAQYGVTLIELMVGIAVGMLVVAVSMGALMLSRGVSGTVSDASGIQQQAAYAMRVIGMQMRQAGSLRVNMSYDTSVVSEPEQARVAVETATPASGGNEFDPSIDTIKGGAASMTVGYRRYTEQITTASAAQSQSRNCVGGPADSNNDQRLESLFTFDATSNELRCAGNGAAAQAIVNNVANFQVRYLLQDNSVGGDSKIKTVDVTGVGSSDWGKVQGIEVCLVLFGSEVIDMPSTTNYMDCDGTTKNMATLTGNRAKRVHMVFRNVFQLRSQGLL